MKNTLAISLVVTAALTSSVSAQTVPSMQSAPFLTGKNVKLSAKEWKAAQMATRWIQNKKDVPVMGDQGQLLFLFGRSMPTIICAPLHPCDLELQAGEKVNNVHVGDKTRWKVSPAVSGPKNNEIVHAIIKPVNIGLMTTLTITTDRRTYHVRLKSRTKKFMPYIGFDYPEVVQAQWAALKARQNQMIEREIIPGTSENLSDLDFKYSIKGKARWKPVRVYNDGIKTIIQMPKAMGQTEAPALLVLGNNGSKQIVNYRLKDDRYIVDYIFDRAELIAGVGSDQTKIVVSRTAK